ncbi:hypothetical protein Q3G72_013582 [Acer saccharum]|nr:hypothetical protein Q3G72_013582 [Acer saccharum]
MLGDPLIIDEKSLSRRNLVHGKMLVLIPEGKVCPSKVKVVNSRFSTIVTVEEDSSQVSLGWVEEILGLKIKGRAKGECSRHKKGSLGVVKYNIVVDLGVIGLSNGPNPIHVLKDSFDRSSVDLSSGDDSGPKGPIKPSCKEGEACYQVLFKSFNPRSESSDENRSTEDEHREQRVDLEGVVEVCETEVHGPLDWHAHKKLQIQGAIATG